MRPSIDTPTEGRERTESSLPRNFCMLDVIGSMDGAASQSRFSLDRPRSEGRPSFAGRMTPTLGKPSTTLRRSVDWTREEGGTTGEANRSEDQTHTDDIEGSETEMNLTEEEMRKASVRAKMKTDAVLIIMMALVVMLQYLDKAIFSYAALLGLEQDLQITMGQYSFAASIYYIGMIAGLPLWTFLLQLFTTDIVMGITVTLWGGVTMGHAGTHNYSGILAVRFFLGFLESAVTPALVLTTGIFYTPLETISRTAFWYSFNGVALILGGGLSYGLLTNPSVIQSSLAIWRQLYLILGGITIFLGLLLFFFMPNHPSTTRLFTKAERYAMTQRLATQASQSAPISGDEKKGKHVQWDQWLESLRDPRLYIFFAGLLAGSVPNGGVTAFSTQLLAGFGFPVAETLLVSIAPGGGQIVSVILFIAVALVSRSRIIGANVLLFIAIAGSAMMYVSGTGRTAKAVGYVLLNFGSPAVVALYSFIGSAVKGRGKRVIFTIVAQLAYALGNIIGPLVFLSSEAPTYPTAKKVIIGTLAGATVSLFLIGALHAFWNRRRGHEKGEEDDGATDFQDKTFRYVY